MECKIHISYSYFEREQSRKNLEYFLAHGVRGRDNITVDLTVKGGACSVDLSPFPNVTATHAENVGYDFGAHARSLAACDHGRHDYFVLMNCSCTGPFSRGEPWYRRFVAAIGGKKRLVGACASRIIGPGYSYRGPLPYVAGVRHLSPGGWFMMTDRAGAGVLRDMLGRYNFRTYQDAHAAENLTGKWMRDAGYGVAGLVSTNRTMNRFASVMVKTRTCRDPAVGPLLRGR